MRFQCDRCGKRYSTDQPLRDGRTYTIKCRVCGHKVVVRSSSAEAPSAPGGRAPEPELPTTLPPPSDAGTSSTVSSAYVLPPDILGSLAAPAQATSSTDPFVAASSDPFAANTAPPPPILPPDLERTPPSRPALHDFITAPIPSPEDAPAREPTPPPLPSSAFARRATLAEPSRPALAVRQPPVWEDEPVREPAGRRKLFLAIGGGVAAAAVAAYFVLSDSGTPAPGPARPAAQPLRAAAPAPAAPPPVAARPPEVVAPPLPEQAAPPPQIPVTSEERLASLAPEPPAARSERSGETHPSRRNEHVKKAPPPPRHVASAPRGRDPAPTTVTVKPVDFGGAAPPPPAVAATPPPPVPAPAPAPVAVPAPAPETRVALARPAAPPPPEPVAAAPAPVPTPPRAIPTPQAPSSAAASRAPAAHEEARSDVMKVLLRKDVDGLGASGTTVEVPTAYGRSFLLAKGLGVAVPPKGPRAAAKTADASAAKEDEPVFPGAGYRRPVPASPNCIEKSLRMPDGRNAGSVTVKFAVGRTGLADLVHVQPGPDFSGGRLEPRLVDAVSSAVKGCRFTPGADEQGRPARLWVVMQVPLGGS